MPRRGVGASFCQKTEANSELSASGPILSNSRLSAPKQGFSPTIQIKGKTWRYYTHLKQKGHRRYAIKSALAVKSGSLRSLVLALSSE
jgi:hypothetical protein